MLPGVSHYALRAIWCKNPGNIVREFTHVDIQDFSDIRLLDMRQISCPFNINLLYRLAIDTSLLLILLNVIEPGVHE